MLDNHYVPDGYGILPFINIFGKKISSYSFFVGLGLLIGIVWFWFTVARVEKIKKDKTLWIVVFTLLFGFLGSKILVLIENINILINDFSKIKNFIFFGKSIVGGLIGGYFGIRIIKKILKIPHVRTGNKVAPAIALGMGIGRIGCFLTGCCFGIETKLPIGINFGDGILRLPTQLLEMIFCFILFGYLFYKQKKCKNLRPGILFQELVIYYFIFRFFNEFIRGTEKNILIFSIYQVICVIGVCFMYFRMRRDKKYE